MQKISPNTGHSSNVYMYDADYDNASGHYIIDMSASWITKSAIFWSDEKAFEIRDILEVDKNGK
jgi:hypothetical protein